ncbi:glycosyltransferase family 2 protein [Lysinibacillus sp. NPDC086135]|uniref:glycosyltransferase family 2 protein n=1 Tax=Lysinibacillus sp. NPDC086135 TaxID=3364130 RepID=UPI0038289770
MGSEILVTVIIPVYNAAPYLKKCLASICQQTLKPIEIITINDGSTDESLSILQQFALQDQRIIIHNKANGGVSHARNRGIDQARGQYVTFVDADDWIEPSMLERLYSAIKESGTEIAKCDIFVDGKNGGNRLNYPSTVNELFDPQECLHLLFTEFNEKHFGFACCKLYSKVFLDKFGIRFEEDMNFSEDVLFITKAITKSKAICYVPQQLYHYNVLTQQSLTRGYRMNGREKYDVIYERVRETLVAENIFTFIETSFNGYVFSGLVNLTLHMQDSPYKGLHLLRAIKEEIVSFVDDYPHVLELKPIKFSLKKKLYYQLLKKNAVSTLAFFIFLSIKKTD